jgi:hypothetical protein
VAQAGPDTIVISAPADQPRRLPAAAGEGKGKGTGGEGEGEEAGSGTP